MLEALRLFLLVGAAANLLVSTMLFRRVGRPLIDWYVRVFTFPLQFQRVLGRDRVVRIWGVGTAGLSLVAWWYLGTPDGEETFRALVPPRMP